MKSIVAFLFCLLATASTAIGQVRPDIILIVGDDIGANVINQGGYATPNIASIAAQGISFSDAHGAPLCVPGRVMLTTGRWPREFGVDRNNNTVLPPTTPTIATTLKAAGYRTAVIGKWHINRYNPLDQGYDRWYGWLRFAPPYFGNDPDIPLTDQRETVLNPGYATEVLADKAIAFLNEPGDEPKFLYFAPTAAHAPLQATPEQLALAPSSLGLPNQLRAAIIIQLDLAVGRILEAKPDALVIWTADNSEGQNGPLRGNKSSIWQGAVRVPMAIRWPGRIVAGQRSAAPVSLVDLLPTIASAAGVAPPVGMDGFNLLFAIPANRALLFTGVASRGHAVRRGRWKLYRDYEGIPEQLYDLIRDPSEKVNVASKRPAVMRALRKQLDQLLAN